MNQPTVYVGADRMNARDSFLYALEAETGLLLWRYALPDASASSPVATPTGVYISASNGGVYALDPTRGTLLWHQQVHHEFPSLPAITNGLLYVSTSDSVSAFQAADGSRQWHQSIPNLMPFCPVVTSDRVYVRSRDGSVLILNAHDGSLLWRTPGRDGGFAFLVATPDVIYLTATGGNLSALQASDGSLLWHQPMCYANLHDPILHQGTLYLHTGEGIQARKSSDGSLLWQVRSPRGFSLAVTKSTLLVSEIRNKTAGVSALRTADGSRAWRWHTSFDQQGGISGPVVAHKAVYVGIGATGGLYALSANDGSILWHIRSNLLSFTAVAGSEEELEST